MKALISRDCELRSVIKFLKIKRRGMFGAGAVLLQEFSWEVFNHPFYSSNPAPSDFQLFLQLKKFLSGHRFQYDRRRIISHSGSNPRRQISTTKRYKAWSHNMTNASIPEVNMLKNSSTLAVSVPINLSIK